jgi:ElaB/YqjD/DUF883 family membrane-anchored ribosome-binding protein
MATTSQPGKTAQDTIGKAADKAQDTIGKTADKAQDLVGKVADKAQDMAGKVADRAQHVAEKAKDYAHTAGQKAEDLTHRVGSGMESLADTIRDKGPHGGTMGQVTSKVAENIDSAGHYLQEEGLSGMADDLTDLIRRNPIPALLIGVALGFLVARATSSRS